MSNIIQMRNPDEVISEQDREYDSGVTQAEQLLESIALDMENKSMAFTAGFWDTIYCVFHGEEA